MFFYIAGWLCNYLVLAASVVRKVHLRFLTGVLVLTLGLLIALRANVGPDTAPVYESMAAHLLRSQPVPHIAPGFLITLHGLVWLTSSPVLAVRGIALLFTALLTVFVVVADVDELFFLVAFFIPVFYFQYGVNVLRIGIATGWLLLGMQQFRRRRKIAANILYLTAFSFHFSVFVVIAYSWFLSARLKNQKALLQGSIGFLAAALFFVVESRYLVEKYHLYIGSGYTAPDFLSGASQLVVCGIILLGLPAYPLPRWVKQRCLWVTTISAVTFFIVARFSYAGLRLGNLVTFALPYTLLLLLPAYRSWLNKAAKVTLGAAGLAGAVFMLRNMLLEPTGMASPFLPYHFL